MVLFLQNYVLFKWEKITFRNSSVYNSQRETQKPQSYLLLPTAFEMHCLSVLFIPS